MFKEEKRTLRREAKRIRAELKNSAADEAIKARVLTSPYAAKESFFVYVNFGSEADTSGILTELIGQGKSICLPRVEGESMRAVLLSQEDRQWLLHRSEENGEGTLQRGKFGTLEPNGEEEFECAVALVPLLLADESGNRLGYGGGFYDRYFAIHPNVLRVGLCYEGQLTSSLPTWESDIPLNAIITEQRLIVCSHRGGKDD